MRLQNQNDLLETCIALLKRQKKGSKIGMIVMTILFPGIIIGLSFIPAEDSSERLWKWLILGFFGVIYIWVIIYQWLERKKYDPDTSPILDLVKYKNRDTYFTWIYPFKFVYNGVPSYYIVFMSKDKKKYQISVKTEEELQLVSSFQGLIQNVTYGFSEELKKQYKKNPESLLVSNYSR